MRSIKGAIRGKQMNQQQREAMIRFHERAAKAYRSLGVNDKADAAERQARILRRIGQAIKGSQAQQVQIGHLKQA